MQWSEVIKQYVAAVKPVTLTDALIPKLISLIDLTSLNDTDTEASVAAFCEKATTPFGHVASLCVYPRFVRLVAAQFSGSPIKVTTVANFPEGGDTLETVLIEIGRALEDGAQEIDVVFPYLRYLSGERQYAQTFVSSCKAVCGNNVLLKIILETGVLSDPAIIADACFDAFTAGADFVKTSTGKVSQGATLEAAATMLLVVRHLLPKLNRVIGVKVSGGIREPEQAAQYIELADEILGREWVGPQTFRIGASRLVDELIKETS